MASIADFFVSIGADISDFQRKMQDVQKSFKQASKDITQAGKTLTKNVSLPLTALGGASFKAAVDFESAFAGVRKTVDATEQQFADLEKGIRNMAKTMPQSAEEIAGVAEAAGQLGIQTDAILGFTKTMVNMGVATDMSSEEAAMALARLATITGMNQKDFDKLGSTIVGLGNNFAATESEIVEMALRLAGAGNTVGMTEDQILGFATSLAAVGINAEAGGSAFSKLFINIANEVATGGKNLEKFAKVAGMSASEFRKAFEDDAASATISFIDGLGGIQSAGGNVFGVLDELGLSEIRLRDALLRSAGASDTMRNALELGAKSWQENNALTDEAEQRYKTMASQLQIFWNNLKDVGITIGGLLIPVVSELLNKIRPWIDRLQELDQGTLQVIVVVGALVAAIGPLLIAIGLIGQGIATITPMFSALGGIITGATMPVWGIIAAIGALIAIGVLLYQNWEQVKEFFIMTWQAILEYLQPVIDVISTYILEKFEGLKEWWLELWPTLQQAFENIWNAIVAFITPIIDGIVALFKWAWPFIEGLIKMVWNNIKGVIDGALKVITNIISAFANLFTGNWSALWENIKSILSGALNVIWNWVQLFGIGKLLKFFGSLGSKLFGKVGEFLGKIVNSFKTKLNQIFDFVKNIFGKITGFFGGLGTTFFNAGKGLIENMYKGIKNMASKVIDGVKNIAKKVRDFLPFSPAKEGPLSDLDKLDFGGPITDSISRALPQVHSMMNDLVAMPDINAGNTFMQTGDRPVVVYLDGREITRGTLPHMEREIRLKTGVTW